LESTSVRNGGHSAGCGRAGYRVTTAGEVRCARRRFWRTASQTHEPVDWRSPLPDTFEFPETTGKSIAEEAVRAAAAAAEGNCRSRSDGCASRCNHIAALAGRRRWQGGPRALANSCTRFQPTRFVSVLRRENSTNLRLRAGSSELMPFGCWCPEQSFDWEEEITLERIESWEQVHSARSPDDPRASEQVMSPQWQPTQRKN